MGRALSLDSVCICQAVPQQSDKLLECHSKDCQSGKFFHLTCLGYKKMPNNSKTTWKCTNCKKSNAKPFHDKSAVPVSTGQENPVTTTTCSSQSHDSEPEFIELDMYNAQDSDSEGESADDIEVTMVTTCESERHHSLRNLDVQDYRLIMSPHGWLDVAIIHSAQVLLQKINPLIEGFQRPTLGPVRNFSAVSGEFVQLLHCLFRGCAGDWVKLGVAKRHGAVLGDAVSKMADENTKVQLVESDIPGAELPKPAEFCTVAILKRWLSCRGAKVSGNRKDLIKRLDYEPCNVNYFGLA